MDKRVVVSIVILLLAIAGAAYAAETDVEGGKDHPLVTRMPGYYIGRYEEKDFDSHKFFAKGKETNVEGRFITIMYVLQPEAKEPSRLQILANYENAIKKIGGMVLDRDDDGNSYMKVSRDGKEIWVHMNAYITSQYFVYIIEKGAMKQEVEANAAVFLSDINSTGKAVVYGVYFDTGKAEIKPESGPALAEMAKLLKGNLGLKVYIVGHTDNVGEAGSNMKLSQARRRRWRRPWRQSTGSLRPGSKVTAWGLSPRRRPTTRRKAGRKTAGSSLSNSRPIVEVPGRYQGDRLLDKDRIPIRGD